MNKTLLNMFKSVDKEGVINEITNETANHKTIINDKELLIINTNKFLKSVCSINDMAIQMNAVLYLINLHHLMSKRDIQKFAEQMRQEGFLTDFDNAEYCIRMNTSIEPSGALFNKNMTYTIFNMKSNKNDESNDYYVFIEAENTDAVIFKLNSAETFTKDFIIKGYIKNIGHIFNGIVDIKNHCTFNKSDEQWYCEGKKVILEV